MSAFLLLAVIGVPALIIAIAVYLMRHPNDPLTRGVAGASAKYNEFYGQGLPPRLPPPPEFAEDPHGHDPETWLDPYDSSDHHNPPR